MSAVLVKSEFICSQLNALNHSTNFRVRVSKLIFFTIFKLSIMAFFKKVWLLTQYSVENDEWLPHHTLLFTCSFP